MEKAFKSIWITIYLICVSVNLHAHESFEETKATSYWACVPVYVEIDYSYLRKGEWVAYKKQRKVILDQAINQFDSYIERKNWGLVNCENRTR